MPFDDGRFYGLLTRGAWRDAMDYLGRFPEQDARHRQHLAVFDAVLADPLAELLQCYYAYYRAAFCLCADNAEAQLAAALRAHFGADSTLEKLEELAKDEAQKAGFSFLGGKTGGYYGPYIWSNTEEAAYEVEFPEGKHPFSIRFLDGFLHKSWLNFLSLGAVSTGGWAADDGVICCIRESYDLQSEAFRVSLLAHEAQHTRDKARGLSDATALEYRAKLVELCYTVQRDLLLQFRHEAGTGAGHPAAAAKIIAAFDKEFGAYTPTQEETRAFARVLFDKSPL